MFQNQDWNLKGPKLEKVPEMQHIQQLNELEDSY